MTFSIIVPVYNAEQYLADCIGSVRAQSDPDWELVLVDDGSSDGSAAICDRAAAGSGNIRVIHQLNSRQLLTRINGVRGAAGDYCLFLDADDTLTPDCLATLRQAIEKHDSPDMVIYSFFYDHPDGTQKKSAPLFAEERTFAGPHKRDVYELFFTGTGLNNVWTKAVKKDVFTGDYPDYAPYARLLCAEDRLYSMGLVSNAERIVYLPAHLYRYRLFPDSVTRQFTLDAVDRFNSRAIYPCETAYMKQWEMDTPEWRQRLYTSYCANLLYVFDRFYLHLKSAEDRARLIDYDWRSFLPEQSGQKYKDIPYLNETQENLFRMILEKDKRGIQQYYHKKKLYQAARDLKRKFIP